MVTTNNHGLCYTNHSLTMEFEVKKINIQMVIHLPKEKTWLLYFCCNKIMVNFYKGKIWLMFSIRIFLERVREMYPVYHSWCFQSAASIYMSTWTHKQSLELLWVTSWAFYNFFWEDYHHIYKQTPMFKKCFRSLVQRIGHMLIR